MKIKKIIVEILKMKKLNKTIKIVEDDYVGDGKKKASWEIFS